MFEKILLRLVNNDDTLTELSLNQELHKVDLKGIHALANALKVNQTLTKLVIYRYEMGNSGAKALAEALKVNQKLSVLVLRQNNIKTSGFIALADALTTNKTLTVIEIAELDPIEIPVMRALIKALRVNRTLTEIYLRLFSRDIDNRYKAYLVTINQLLTRNWFLKVMKQIEIKDTNLKSLNFDCNDLVFSDFYTTTGRNSFNRKKRQINKIGVCYLLNALKNNSTVTEIDFGNKRLSDVEIQTLSELLTINTKLTKITLTSSESDFSMLLHALKNNSTVTEIDFGNKRLSDVEIQMLSELLTINTKLTKITLTSSESDFSMLLHALKNNLTITEIDFGSKKFSNIEIQALSELLTINSKITSILLFSDETKNKLEENINNLPLQIGQKIKEKINSYYSNEQRLTEILLQKLYNNDNELTEISFRSNFTVKGYSHITDKETLLAIIEALKINHTVKVMKCDNSDYLDQSRFDVLLALLEALKTNQSVTELEFVSFRFEKILPTLTDVLRTNSILQTLNLSFSLISNTIKNFAEILKSNQTLTALNLSHNHIDDDGALALAEAFEKNQTLTSINLSNNKIKNDGAHRLVEMLKNNQTILTLDLSDNELTDGRLLKNKSLDKIEEYTRRNQANLFRDKSRVAITIELLAQGCRDKNSLVASLPKELAINIAIHVASRITLKQANLIASKAIVRFGYGQGKANYQFSRHSFWKSLIADKASATAGAIKAAIVAPWALSLAPVTHYRHNYLHDFYKELLVPLGYGGSFLVYFGYLFLVSLVMLNKTACTVNNKTIINIGFNECATEFDIGNILDKTANFTLEWTVFGIAGMTVFGLTATLFFAIAASTKSLVNTIKFGASVGVNVESKDIVDQVLANFKM